MSGLRDPIARREWDRAYKARNPDRVIANRARAYAKAKERYKTDPTYRAKLRATTKRWELRNPDKVTAIRIKHRSEKRAWLDAQKAGRYCQRCGESDSRCLDFHHRDPREKKIALAAVGGRGWAIKKMQAEIEKCVLICANCHRKEHWAELRSSKWLRLYG